MNPRATKGMSMPHACHMHVARTVWEAVAKSETNLCKHCGYITGRTLNGSVHGRPGPLKQSLSGVTTKFKFHNQQRLN